MNTLFTLIQTLKNREDGQGLTEYGLIVALVALAAAATLSGVGVQLTAIFGKISTDLALQ
jgi:Flp pilus assembly pilin Flp